jgi:steroid 5-alpha reductase family enzyme
VALLERDISERRPAYREYVQHTNAFIPGPRKSVPASGETGSGA